MTELNTIDSEILLRYLKRIQREDLEAVANVLRRANHSAPKSKRNKRKRINKSRRGNRK